jgi:hypothetical protein
MGNNQYSIIEPSFEKSMLKVQVFKKQRHLSSYSFPSLPSPILLIPLFDDLLYLPVPVLEPLLDLAGPVAVVSSLPPALFRAWWW